MRHEPLVPTERKATKGKNASGFRARHDAAFVVVQVQPDFVRRKTRYDDPKGVSADWTWAFRLASASQQQIRDAHVATVVNPQHHRKPPKRSLERVGLEGATAAEPAVPLEPACPSNPKIESCTGPSRVETIALPLALDSMILKRVSRPILSGTIITWLDSTHTRGSSTKPVTPAWSFPRWMIAARARRLSRQSTAS